MASTVNTLDVLFKQTYSKQGVQDATINDRPFFGMIDKTAIFGADQLTRAFVVPVKVGNNPGVGGVFATAQTRSLATSSTIKAFQVTTSKQYGVVTIDNESMERAVGAENAFMEIQKLEVDATLEKVANRLHRNMYNDGTGAFAQVGNTTQMPSFATPTVVLNNASQMVFIEIGDELTVSGTESGSERAFGTNGHGLYVGGMNIDAGTFYCVAADGVTQVNANSAADGIPTITALDWLAIRGDRQTAGTVGGTTFSGFQGWCPNAATGVSNSDSFMNVNRSVAVDFLAGTRYDGSNDAIEDALIRASNQLALKGGKVDTAFVNHKHFTDLVKSISSRGTVPYLDVGVAESPTIGYQGIRIRGAKGDIDVIPDWGCPTNLCAMLNMDDWHLGSVGGDDPIRFMSGDGLEFLRQPTSDSIQAYVYNYGALYSTKPKNAINVTLPV